MPPPIDIHPDITRASTLPSHVYRDRDTHDRLIERVFARSWQFIGDTTLARTPGHVHPFTFLPGAVEEPLLLARDEDDVLRCLSNVCTHRGNIVCGAPGRAASLRCPYHGRRFALDGSFQSMPEFERAAGFPRPEDDLPRCPLERLGPFLFTAVDPAFPFAELVAPMIERTSWMPLDTLVRDSTRSRDYLVQANWALYCDNYLEGFHIPFVHGGLNEALDYGAYRTELSRWSSLQVGVGKGGEHRLTIPPVALDAGGASIAAYYYFFFPNLMFNVYPWGVSINVVQPLAPDRTKVSFISYVGDERKLDHGAGAELDRVEREDEAVVEAVQRGIGSRLYDRGRYSPTREQGVHHFHRLIAEAMNE